MKALRIASISIAAEHGKAGQFAWVQRQAEHLAREAARAKPDLIVFPECFAHSAYPVKAWPRVAEDLRGNMIRRFGALARELGCMILCPMFERSRSTGKSFNSVVFLSNCGKPLSVYRKRFLTLGELDAGIQPGEELALAETPWGRMGALLCYDLNFVELHAALRQARPRIIFFCSMFRGGLRLRYLALECACYVVSTVACNQDSTSHQLINPLGRVLSEGGGTLQESFARMPQYLEETINMDYGVFHIDFNADADKLKKLRNRYAGKVRLEVAQAEGVFLLESLSPRLSIDRVRKECGLEPSLDYFDHARQRRHAFPGLGGPAVGYNPDVSLHGPWT